MTSTNDRRINSSREMMDRSHRINHVSSCSRSLSIALINYLNFFEAKKKLEKKIFNKLFVYS